MSRIVLVRHGQASWGKRAYDKLSDLGREQARIVGAELATRDLAPTLVVSGTMERQRDTATGLVEAAGWDLTPQTRPGWDEYDHASILTAYKPAYRSMTLLKADMARTLRPRAAFDEMYAVATQRWVAGENDADYGEPFAAFGERVLGGLGEVADELGPGETAVVVSSAGAISWVAASLLDGGAPTWTALQRVLANASLTTVSVGAGDGGAARRPVLRTFNDTTHLERVPDLLTTR
ncbi:broad specificity phosphatase PhoE [Knoellia remsis]|uniref:Broad specificity phosphatase PhoE n=1 Tax=Knoellia remsis TaxID=407159 RepID=A0A2T0UGR0_9MICO|nr:histidine phosphatase family protein [Knoellia remsis]PRY57007.1 broad specificity phosphatase PhoE [Knoellia remsis]